MIGISKKLVPGSELRRLMQGSLEERVSQIGDAVQSHFHEMNSDSDAEIVATHSDAAVVFSEGMFHRAKYEVSDNGNVRVVEVEPLQVETFEENEAHKLLYKEAREVVDLFINGATPVAKARLQDLALQAASVSQPDDKRSLETVESLLKMDRAWKSLYEQRGKAIRKFIMDDLEELDRERLQPKFRQLYEGQISDEKLFGYASLVEEDLEIVLDRAEAVHDAARTAFESVSGTLRKLDNDIIPMYEEFATDLLDDLQTIHKAASKAVFETNDVAVRGRLRDTIAEALHPYEVASRFVVEVANRLTEAQKE